MPNPNANTRREFLRLSAALGVGAVTAAAIPWRIAHAAEPWGSLEPLGDGLWAMLSTPMTDRTTLCNGGLVAGRDGVLLVEAFGTDAGARWMRERSRALTGREPTQVVVTHYHSDHTAGLPAAREAGAELWCTARTRDDIRTRNQNAPVQALGDARLVPEAGEARIDLGGCHVRLIALEGHTASDVAALVEESEVVFAGDLLWYGMFPNFVDAQPSRLTPSLRRLRALDARAYVSGHGRVTDAAGVDAFIELLDLVERSARDAMARGITAEEAAAAFRMPAAMTDWTLFNARYYERAIGAWMRELTPR